MTPDYHTDNPIKDGEQDADLLVVRARNLAMIHAGIAHDLNGRLNAMVVNLEMVKQARAVDRETEPYTEALSKEVKQLNGLLTALINQLAPIDRSLGRFNLKDLIEEVLVLASAHTRHRRIRLEVAIPDATINVLGVKSELKQAVLSLMLFTLEAMPSGGELRIELTQTVQDTTLELCSKGADSFNINRISQEPATDKELANTIMRTTWVILKKHRASIKTQHLADNQVCIRITLPLAV
jgi:signal transduction histidine kinase